MARDSNYIRIPLEAVESSNLGAVGYDPQRRILAVQFAKTATIFHYASVSQELVAELMTAESKGKVYASKIRGKFSGMRMTGPCRNCGLEGWVGDDCEDCGTAQHEAVPYVQPLKPGERDPRD